MSLLAGGLKCICVGVCVLCEYVVSSFSRQSWGVEGAWGSRVCTCTCVQTDAHLALISKRLLQGLGLWPSWQSLDSIP